MSFWLINGGPDGFRMDGPYTKAELEEQIDEMLEYESGSPKFLSKMPEDIEYWPEGSYVVLEGKIVVPKPIEVIKKMAL